MINTERLRPHHHAKEYERRNIVIQTEACINGIERPVAQPMPRIVTVEGCEKNCNVAVGCILTLFRCYLLSL